MIVHVTAGGLLPTDALQQYVLLAIYARDALNVKRWREHVLSCVPGLDQRVRDLRKSEWEHELHIAVGQLHLQGLLVPAVRNGEGDGELTERGLEFASAIWSGLR